MQCFGSGLLVLIGFKIIPVRLMTSFAIRKITSPAISVITDAGFRIEKIKIIFYNECGIIFKAINQVFNIAKLEVIKIVPIIGKPVCCFR